MHRIFLIITILMFITGCTSQARLNDNEIVSKSGNKEATASQKTASKSAPEDLGPDEWLTTLEAVVNDILSGMSEEDKEDLRKFKRDELIRFHHGWGTGIRNYYGLWRGNFELLESVCGKPCCHPDDASMIIIEKVWEAVRK